MPRFKAIPLMNKNRGVLGVNLGHLWEQADELRAMLERIVALVGEGALAPVIDAKVPFHRAAEAHRRIQERKNFGKVLRVPEEGAGTTSRRQRARSRGAASLRAATC